MLSDSSLRLMALAGQGFCCSQILLLLALEDMGHENSELIRAIAGLCNGMGDCDGPCGILSGGSCLLALYTAKGTPDEVADERLSLLQESFRDWFVESTAQYGGITCGEITGGNCRTPDPSRCGTLLGAAHSRLQDILRENGLDPYTGPEAY